MNIILHCNHRTRTKFDWFWRTLWWEQAKFIEEIICFIPPGFSPPIYYFCGSVHHDLLFMWVGSPWFIIYVGRFTVVYYLCGIGSPWFNISVGRFTVVCYFCGIGSPSMIRLRQGHDTRTTNWKPKICYLLFLWGRFTITNINKEAIFHRDIPGMIRQGARQTYIQNN